MDQGSQPLTARCEGSEWFGTDGSSILDLRDTGDEVLVGLLEVALPEELPDEYGFPKAGPMNRFRERIAARQPLPCLVIDDGAGIVRWFAPGLGLVREENRQENRGRVRQLVYSKE